MAMDYEIDTDLYCCKCNHSPLNYRSCSGICEDGYTDESDEDAINFLPGDLLVMCPECRGTGVEWWCPSCGENLSGRLQECGLTDEDNVHYRQ